ncbi:MAG: 16S rRNA (cytidine(1402)-2'-O)-methyltransferase [Spirochaetota bacterium]|nr:16S rRNA (cytidine(1402)-2'-O)-methyltransferase [Spirochaetota bacterium]
MKTGRNSKNPGILYVIASPIGNLEDISYRAVRILKEEIEHLFCEDTRQTRKLLNNYEIKSKTYSLHSHSSNIKIESAIKLLNDGYTVGYITDSGTPGLSDPGSSLIREARKINIPIVPLPGPSALSNIISVSGFPGKNIIFLGFLSRKDGKRKKELEKLKDYCGVIVIYESPHRIKKLLKDVYEIFPKCEIVIGREMTKIYEEYITGTIEEIYNDIDNFKERGEFTIAIFNSY